MTGYDYRCQQGPGALKCVWAAVQVLGMRLRFKCQDVTHSPAHVPLDVFHMHSGHLPLVFMQLHQESVRWILKSTKHGKNDSQNKWFSTGWTVWMTELRCARGWTWFGNTRAAHQRAKIGSHRQILHTSTESSHKYRIWFLTNSCQWDEAVKSQSPSTAASLFPVGLSY